MNLAAPAFIAAGQLPTHDGVVYQNNLGRTSAALASKMTRFDPDPTWSLVKP